LDWADVVLIEYPWQFDYCYRLLPKGRFVLASHNVEIQAFTSSAEAVGVRVKNNRWLRYIETMEKNAVARADLILAVSPEDRREFVRRYGADPARIVVMPNGADTEQLVPADRQARAPRRRALSLPDKPTVIFVNSQTHPPGRPAFQWIQRLAEKSNGFTFLVAGSICSRPDVKGNLVMTGPVDDIVPYFQAADIAVCPVEYGGGTKIKLIESMASGLPTVTFSESLYGMECRDGEHLLVVEKSEQALLSALHRVADDSQLADRLGRSGREFVVRHHDWEKIAAKLESVLLELLESSTRTATSESTSCTG
jgi:glycosyltransferase involved in cell wall biosynthesis